MNIKGNTRRIAGVHLEPRRPRPDPYVYFADREQHHLRQLAKLPPEERPKPRLPRITAFVAPMFG